MGDDEFVAVEREVNFQESERDFVQCGRLDKPKSNAANGFQNTVDTFERNRGTEALVQQQITVAGRFGRGDCGMNGGVHRVSGLYFQGCSCAAKYVRKS